MTAPAGATWLVRTVHEGGGGPAPGVPVTLLDGDGNPAGYWVSDGAGVVAIPKSDAAQVRLRVGLRSEEPITLAADALNKEIVELAAPKSLVPAATGGGGERLPAPRARTPLSFERPADPPPPGHVLQFVRLALLPLDLSHAPAALSSGATPAAETGAAAHPVEFLEAPESAGSTGLRYGVLIDLEQYWQPLGYVTGDLLYSLGLPPGDATTVSVIDGRWPDPLSRPLEVLARMMASAAQVHALTGDDAPVPLDPLTLPPSMGPESGLGGAAAEALRAVNERAARMSQVLRNRPLRIAEAAGGGGAPVAATRALRNQSDQVLTYYFYEPLERWRVTARAARLRPAVLVPFRIPALGTRAAVRQYGAVFRRVLRDRSLEPDLERLLSGRGPGGSQTAPVSELRLVVQRAAGAHTPDLRQVWCFLHVDATRYTVHFFPIDAVAGVDAPTETPHWIGAIRLADFHRTPLQYPGALSIQNGSGSMLAFAAVHIEGRIADQWVRLHTLADLVLPPSSQVRLASLAQLADGAGSDPHEGRLLAHIGANLAYYAAAIVAGGDPGARYLTLAQIRSASGYALADVVENTVVGVVGNLLAFPLRHLDFAPPGLRAALTQYTARPIRVPEETVVTLPNPGVWVSAQGAANADQAAAAEAIEERGTLSRSARGRRTIL